jgi:hypothetical protein
MAAEPLMTPTAICEECWLSDHLNWEPESMDSDGNILMKLAGVEVPEKRNDGVVEICGMCGSITIAGIYEFRDISTLIPLEDDDNENEYIFDINNDYLEDEE